MITIDKTYPVGSIYMSMNNIDLGILFGGTQEQLTDRFLVGVGGSYEINTTGGAISHNHFNGSYYAAVYIEGIGNTSLQLYYASRLNESYTSTYRTSVNSVNHEQLMQKNAQTVGVSVYRNSGSTSILPPYLAAYMQKRIG